MNEDNFIACYHSYIRRRFLFSAAFGLEKKDSEEKTITDFPGIELVLAFSL